MKLNHTFALILTLIADFILLLLGASLIAFLNVGGILVFLIEFYFIRAIHRSIYKLLTGNGQSEQEEFHRNDDTEDEQSKEENKQSYPSSDAEVHSEVPVDVLDESDFTPMEVGEIVQVVENGVSETQYEENASYNIIQRPKAKNHTKNIVWITISLIALVVALALIMQNTKQHSTNSITQTDGETSIEEENLEETPSDSYYKTTPDSYKTDDERWDADNCVYSNFKYGFSFMLPNDVAWQLTTGTSKHTVFKIVQPDTEITMFVNVHPLTNIKGDMWDNYDLFVNQVLPYSQNATNSNSAEQVKNSKHKKCEFCGKHAIKVENTSTLYDDRYDAPIDIETINYVFLHHGALMTLALKSYTDVKEDLLEEGFNVESLLTSFLLIPTKED